jgi:hypothetical protein
MGEFAILNRWKFDFVDNLSQANSYTDQIDADHLPWTWMIYKITSR